MKSMENKSKLAKKPKKRPVDNSEKKNDVETKKLKTEYSVVEFKLDLSEPSTLFIGMFTLLHMISDIYFGSL